MEEPKVLDAGPRSALCEALLFTEFPKAKIDEHKHKIVRKYDNFPPDLSLSQSK